MKGENFALAKLVYDLVWQCYQIQLPLDNWNSECGQGDYWDKEQSLFETKKFGYRIWFSIDFALMGKMRKLNLSNIFTRVCMEFDFSSARVIESQLFILGNNWGLQAFPSPTLIMSNRCSIKFNKRFTLFFLFILPSDCQVTTISHFFVMFVQKQKFLWDSRRRMCVLLLQKISENEFSTYLLLITKNEFLRRTCCGKQD